MAERGEGRSDGRARRAAIVAEAAGVMLEGGLRALTTREVAARLGVGAGLVSHYFAVADLRAEAFKAALARALGPPSAEPRAALEEFMATAFDPSLDGLWRLWVEASEMAGTDAALREALGACNAAALGALAATLAAGTDAGLWWVPDAPGTALRLVALHEGLLGFVLAGEPPLPRAEAERHLRRAVMLEAGISGLARP